MDAPVASKANSETMYEIVKPLADSSSLVMGLSRDRGANLTLDMFPQER
jgi:hypothetical protein